MLKHDVIAKLIFLRKYSFCSFKKLANTLLRDLITSMPSSNEKISIRIVGKMTRFVRPVKIGYSNHMQLFHYFLID